MLGETWAFCFYFCLLTKHLIIVLFLIDMVSFRNKVLGSWFMQAVIYIFRKNAHCEDILHMLADVSLEFTIQAFH